MGPLQHQEPEAQHRVHTRSVSAGGGLPAAALGGFPLLQQQPQAAQKHI
jgi:hypothetical protein